MKASIAPINVRDAVFLKYVLVLVGLYPSNFAGKPLSILFYR